MKKTQVLIFAFGVLILAFGLYPRLMKQVEVIKNAQLEYDAALEPRLQELLSVFDGKSIALVGPAKSYEGSGFGKQIDSYDLVVRVNSGAFPDPNFWKDYGQRVDILFANLIELNVRMLRDNQGSWKNIKWLVNLGNDERDLDIPAAGRPAAMGHGAPDGPISGWSSPGSWRSSR